MRVLLTGAGGFLGQHVRLRLRALTDHQVVPVDRASWPRLAELARGAEAVIHVAGINRGDPAEVEHGNVDLAEDVAAAVRAGGGSPVLVFANSIQAGNGTPYGTGKAAAAAVLAEAAQVAGSVFVDVRLPNLFGEHGRPDYNSFVASFCHALVDGRTPEVVDRPVELMHAQAAAQVLIESLARGSSAEVTPAGTPTSVQQVLDKLRCAHDLYRRGDLPPLVDDLDVDLFNTLRAAGFPAHHPIPLVPRSDHRGRLTEVVRAHGGQGQTFVSTTRPGITRGQHFHLRKVERFVVLSGRARISLRRMFTDEVVSFDVDGDTPVAVDMPTTWAHDITNTGSSELTTLFWTHVLFDPARPDTFPEPVQP